MTELDCLHNDLISEFDVNVDVIMAAARRIIGLLLVHAAAAQLYSNTSKRTQYYVHCHVRMLLCVSRRSTV